MDRERIKKAREVTKRIFELEDVHSVLLFGSLAKGEFSDRSDVDICVVSLGSNNLEKLANKVSGMVPKRYDVVVFELLPLYMKIEVIKNHIILHTRNKLELYEYFYIFRKLWKDQEHRQKITIEEAKKLFRTKTKKVR